MNISDKVNIYVVYHDYSLIDTYKLDELDNSIYKLYNVNNFHNNSLDILSLYVCEFTCLYHVLKTKLYSPYIGFCHYKRLISLEFELLPENIKVIGCIHEPMAWRYMDTIFLNFLMADFKQFIIDHYDINTNPYKIFITNRYKMVRYISNELFITTWEIFEEVTNFIIDFLDYIDKKYKLNYNPALYYKFVLNLYIGPRLQAGFESKDYTWYYENGGKNFFRIIALFIEYCEGFYYGTLAENEPICLKWSTVEPID